MAPYCGINWADLKSKICIEWVEWSKKLNEIDDVVDDDDDDDDNDFGDKIRFLDMNKYNFYFGCNGSN